MKKLYLFPLLAFIAACSAAESSEAQDSASPSGIVDTAIFAGGCFWCVEKDFEKLPGVIEAVSGYTGGFTQNPTYKQVSRTETGHYEAVEVRFDPRQITYASIELRVSRSSTSIEEMLLNYREARHQTYE